MKTEIKKPDIDQSWLEILKDEFHSAYFLSLKTFLIEEKKKEVIYPPSSQIFSAFNTTSFENVKVVLIGQDPYHGEGQANGLCFSVNKNTKHPPSLRNIFKELSNDIEIPYPKSGDLTPWAKQGVLLLNATLTVRKASPGSHQKRGWEKFTDTVIKKISDKKSDVVFLLWGSFAQQKKALIDTNKHHVLEAAHPSPFSAHRGFFGCRHFSKTNEFLASKGINEINWTIE